MVYEEVFWIAREKKDQMRFPSETYDFIIHSDYIQHISKNPDQPSSDYVKYVQKSSEEILGFIKEKTTFYKDRNSTFYWTVTDSTKPENLSDLLLEHGFKLDVHQQLMVLDLQNADIPDVPKIQYEQEILSFQEMTEREDIVEFDVMAYPLPSKEAALNYYRYWIEQLELRGQENPIIVLYDRIDGMKKVIAFSGYVIMDESPKLGYMAGGITHPEYRNRGLYNFSISNRLSIMKDQVIEYAFVHANVETSAPTLSKHGFKKVYDERIFVYKP